MPICLFFDATNVDDLSNVFRNVNKLYWTDFSGWGALNASNLEYFVSTASSNASELGRYEKGIIFIPETMSISDSSKKPFYGNSMSYIGLCFEDSEDIATSKFGEITRPSDGWVNYNCTYDYFKSRRHYSYYYK